MSRQRVPQPPYIMIGRDTFIQNGARVCHIWVFTPAGLSSIETQYATARQIMQLLGCSRATAYRIIKRHGKRYWLCDLRPTEQESCLSVLPLSVLERIQVQPQGNPHFRNGLYQQDIAKRRRRYTK